MNGETEGATREKLIQAATEQFAARGFYGASIAQIAGELGLTKQALLYHFKRKEDLYAQVIKSISIQLQRIMQEAIDPESSQAQQFEDMMLAVYDASVKSSLTSKVLMRELIDHQRRHAPPEEWYLKAFLDGLVVRLDAAGGAKGKSNAEKLAAIYRIISAIEYFSASDAVLMRFYGDAELAKMTEAYRADLQVQIRNLFGSAV